MKTLITQVGASSGLYKLYHSKCPPNCPMNVFYLRPLQNPNAETVAQSNGLLQHLEDAETVEFEIRDKEPGVKYSTDGRSRWTLISIRNCFSTRGDEYDVKYLRRCQQIRIPYSSKFSWHNIFVNFVINLEITKIFIHEI